MLACNYSQHASAADLIPRFHQRCAEFDFFHSYSASVIEKLTPAPSMTPDYKKLLTPDPV